MLEAELVAAGVDSTEAFYRSCGYEVDEAKTYASNWKRHSNRRGGRGRSTNWTHADSKHADKINSPSYRAGRSAGDGIGLDSQVGTIKRKLIT